MQGADDKLLIRLLATFQEEARDHIRAIDAGLLQLEKDSGQQTEAGILDSIFRAAHSLKGAARTVNLQEIETVCQSLESIFAALKRAQLIPSPTLFDLLHRAVNTLGQLLQFVEKGSADRSTARVGELVGSLKAVLAENGAQAKAAVRQSIQPWTAPLDVRQQTEPPQPALADTIRVSTAKLDTVLRQAEELLAAKLDANQRATRLEGLLSHSSEWKRKWARLHGEMRTLQHAVSRKENGNGRPLSNASLTRVVEFLNWNQDFIQSLDVELNDLAKATAHDRRSVAAMVDHLLDEMKKVVMLPFSTLLDVFPRFVRELSREQGKEVELIIRGGEIEMDRRVLEEMKDPVIHLIRNCLDHGIEPLQERLQNNKPPRGTITISISPKDSNTVELMVADDGRGIDRAKVKTAATKSGLLSQEKAQSLPPEAALSFIFQPGISTTQIITDISGRGLGLAIAKEKVEKLKGSIFVETELGKGTSFRMALPLTLARFRGIIVRVQEQQFVIPTSNVERVARIKNSAIQTVENRRTIAPNGHAISLVGLEEALRLTPAAIQPGQRELMPYLVLTSGEQRIAFLVDEIVGEEEVLVKTLGKQLVRVLNIAGATILATGKVVPILNVADLIQTAIETSDAGTETPGTPGTEAATEKKSVLIAEDSITSRSLLKSILETAGYQVQTAVDGIDAFTKLRSHPFHAVVSDVDMPRMNGFGLTAKIRADKKLNELPVILVTALDSRSDREHGIDVGADAYIIKSSFDQSNLLEVIRRLI